MEIPPTLYIMIGAVLAAFLTGVFNLTQLIVSKENTVSEFRQEWLNSLREEVSKIQGIVETLLRLIEHKLLPNNNSGLSDEEIAKFRSDNAASYRDLNEMRYRVLLRFTKEEEEQQKSIKATLDQLIDAFYGPCKNLDDIRNLQDKLGRETQQEVRKTWEEVKKGEQIFRSLRIGLIWGIAIFFLCLLMSPVAFYKLRRMAHDRGASSQPAAKLDWISSMRALRDAESGLARAAGSKNPDLIVASYDSDGAFITSTGEMITGKQSLLGLWSHFLSTPGHELTRNPARVEISRTGDLGFALGSWEQKQLREEPTIKGTYVTIWKRQADGTWKILLDSL